MADGGTPRFRTSFTSQAGNQPAEVVQGKIVNLNMVNWTVDVVSQFDRKQYFNIQVGSPYLHYSNGEGLSVFPEIGAKVMVTLPSDTSPPYVSAFIMPVENTDMATTDAPLGTTSQAKPNRTSSGASFAGGRPRVKPGDIMLRTRDDNFVILHRGGILQLGATELAQRIYIPLNNAIMDVSENYAHHNSGGSMLWSVQTGPAFDNPPTEFTQSFRVYANDKSADVRVKYGSCSDPMVEPSDGASDMISELGMATKDNFIVCEVVIAPAGFNPQTGTQETGAKKSQVLRFFFDRAGNVLLRTSGSIGVRTTKKLHVSADGGIQLDTTGTFNVTAADGATIDGGAFTNIRGGVVRLGPGSTPVARVGDVVQVVFPFTPMPSAPVPLTLYGIVTSGEATVLA